MMVRTVSMTCRSLPSSKLVKGPTYVHYHGLALLGRCVGELSNRLRGTAYAVQLL